MSKQLYVKFHGLRASCFHFSCWGKTIACG